MKAKSLEIEKQIEDLKSKLAGQKKRELEATEAELLKLVRKANCHAEVIGFAKRQIALRRNEKRGGAV